MALPIVSVASITILCYLMIYYIKAVALPVCLDVCCRIYLPKAVVSPLCSFIRGCTTGGCVTCVILLGRLVGWLYLPQDLLYNRGLRCLCIFAWSVGWLIVSAAGFTIQQGVALPVYLYCI